MVHHSGRVLVARPPSCAATNGQFAGTNGSSSCARTTVPCSPLSQPHRRYRGDEPCDQQAGGRRRRAARRHGQPPVAAPSRTAVRVASESGGALADEDAVVVLSGSTPAPASSGLATASAATAGSSVMGAAVPLAAAVVPESTPKPASPIFA